MENSWGEEKDKPGYLMMTDSWFSEYVYEVVVDKKYVPADIMAVLKQDPVVLPAWDPMGSLACIVCGKDEHLAHLWYIRWIFGSLLTDDMCITPIKHMKEDVMSSLCLAQ